MHRLSTAAIAAVTFAVSPIAAREAFAAAPKVEEAGGREPCTPPLTEETVVRCALAQSPEVKRARLELAALEGRRVAADIWLPANPVLAFTAAGRAFPAIAAEASGQTAFNWSLTLSQELEIAGQRPARLDAVDAEAAAQVRRVAVAEQEVAAAALSAFYRLLAAQEGMELARGVAAVAERLGVLAEGRAREELASAVDADVARAEAVRFGLFQFEAAQRLASAQAELAALLGLESGTQPELSGALAPASPTVEQVDVEHLVAQALTLRGELAAAEGERQALSARREVLKRERIPNPTLSFFYLRDGFAENVLGAGLSLPIPLPAPVGRTKAGEIAEVTARIDQAGTDLEGIRRRVRLEVSRAVADERQRAAALRLVAPELLQRVPDDLRRIAAALGAGRLSIRETLLAQRSLIELREAYLNARLAYAASRVELRRAAGLPLSSGVVP